MRHTAILCYTKDGLLNPDALTTLQRDPEINRVVAFTDGTPDALTWIDRLAIHPYLVQGKGLKLGLGTTPKFELRAQRADGTLTRPGYVFKEEDKVGWLCMMIAAPYIKIRLTDTSSKTPSEVELDAKTTATICHVAYRLWRLFVVAQNQLGFPAVAIDAMTRWTYDLSPERIDIAQLRQQTGLSTLDYNPSNDMLELTVGGDLFTAKLSILNTIYGELILPLFNKVYGRRFKMEVSIVGNNGHTSDPKEMSYGTLGRIIEQMQVYMISREITPENPITPQDFVEFAKKVRINEESCVWVNSSQALAELARVRRTALVPEQQRELVPCLRAS